MEEIPRRRVFLFFPATRQEYFYTGQELTRREWHPYTPSDPGVTGLNSQSTYRYDTTGDLTEEVHTDYTTGVTTTRAYAWTWEAGANRLTSFTAGNGVTTTLAYNAAGRLAHRTTASGTADYVYVGDSDWLAAVVWHALPSGNTFDVVRYGYTNGRPTRLEVGVVQYDGQGIRRYDPWMVQYDWHGNAAVWISSLGDGAINQRVYDPWGTPLDAVPTGFNPYRWNAAWGYQYLDDLGLYYVHGRWYNPDIGRFLSPDDSGDYRYGSGNDAVNRVWTQIVGGALYQAARNNVDAAALALYFAPPAREAYEALGQSIESSVPDTIPFRAGRVLGSTVTVAQGLTEISIAPTIAGGGTALSWLANGGGDTRGRLWWWRSGVRGRGYGGVGTWLGRAGR